MSDPTAYVVTLKPPDGADGLQLLQAALKTLGRRHNLRCLSIQPVTAGRCTSDEPPPITPRLMSVRDTARYLGLGMRPGEVVAMRACDLDTSGKVWTYTPAEHKTEHHGHARTVYLGPRAQLVLRSFLRRELAAFLFSLPTYPK